VSQVERGPADSQTSLNLSDSWSKGRAAECQSEKNGGARCNPDITICECAERRMNSIWLNREARSNDARRMASKVAQPAGAYMDEDDDDGYETADPVEQEDHDVSNPQDNAEPQNFLTRLEKLERISRTQEERYETATETMAAPVRTFADAAHTTPLPHRRNNTHANENVKTERTTAGSSKDDERTHESPRGQSGDNQRNNDD
jgi:hypothetical protein